MALLYFYPMKPLRGIIFPVFDKQIREAMIQYIAADVVGNPFNDRDSISVHPKIPKSGFFCAYDKAKYIFESDLPVWRRHGAGKSKRPNYKLVKGSIKLQSYQEILIAAIDDWVRKNWDT